MGTTLAQADGVFFVPEPFNPRQDWFPTITREPPILRWFTYVCEENEDQYKDFLDEVQGLKMPPLRKWMSTRLFRRPVNSAQRLVFSCRSVLFAQRPLLKDPIAFFSAEWIARTYGGHIIVMIRHPAAFVNSVVRLSFRLDFKNLLEQPRLVAELLPEFEDQIREYARNEPTPIDGAAFEWVIIHRVIQKYQSRHPEWIFLRHEDISRDPERGFERLYGAVGLEFTSRIATYIRETTGAGNPIDSANHLEVKRDSRANVQKWKTRLDSETIKRIRECVEPLASAFYSEDEW